MAALICGHEKSDAASSGVAQHEGINAAAGGAVRIGEWKAERPGSAAGRAP